MLVRAKLNRLTPAGFSGSRLGGRKSLSRRLRRTHRRIRSRVVLTSQDALEIGVVLAILSMIFLFLILRAWLA